MTLSERDQRVLRQIEHSLACAEPRLNRALTTGQLPMLRSASLAELHQNAEQKRWTWAAAAIVSLLAGIALLVAGLMLNARALTWIGISLAPFAPSAIACIYRKRNKKNSSSQERADRTQTAG